MAVIPPWISLDPIAPARIRLQANQQRNAAAASERAAQAQAQELQFRRDQAANQAAQEEGRLAAQERAAERKDQVFKQTQDNELAQVAQQLQFKREAQAAKTQQFEQNLRLKQQAAEAEAKSAAKQMQGMQAVQKGLQAGQPLQKLISENAPLLFAKHPERMPSAVPRVNRVAPAPDFTARELMNEDGTGTGVKVRAGAGGSMIPLPRNDLTPEGMMKEDLFLANLYANKMESASDAEKVELRKKIDAITTKREEIRARRSAPRPAPAPATSFPVNPVGGPGGPSPQPVVPPTGGGASIEEDDEEDATDETVRVRSPDGKMGTIPADQLAEALKDGYEEIESQV